MISTTPSEVTSKLWSATSTPVESMIANVMGSLCVSAPATPHVSSIPSPCLIDQHGMWNGGPGAAQLGPAGQAPFKPAPGPAVPATSPATRKGGHPKTAPS